MLLVGSGLTGPRPQTKAPVQLGAQPGRRGKAKEFELHDKNKKDNNGNSGTIRAVGTGNTPVLREDLGICSPLLVFLGAQGIPV